MDADDDVGDDGIVKGGCRAAALVVFCMVGSRSMTAWFPEVVALDSESEGLLRASDFVSVMEGVLASAERAVIDNTA